MGAGAKGCALWARRVLKFDRLFAGGFLGLTAPAGLRVVVAPMGHALTGVRVQRVQKVQRVQRVVDCRSAAINIYAALQRQRCQRQHL